LPDLPLSKGWHTVVEVASIYIYIPAELCLYCLIPKAALPIATGEDLLVASADKPFRFPATFTFVVRSFTVLDGIGKSLNPRFDISEIAAPYARGLLLEARPQFKKLAEEFRKRASKQARQHALCLGRVSAD
jgi:predicted unusual protein kinase regulating ubiquinone biosynthesis (AarF/ABC1/UbiB family)